MILNLALRMLWVKTLLPLKLIYNDMSLLLWETLFSLSEPFRRAMINFFKLELMQIKAEGNFNQVESYKFPFKI